MVDIVSGDHADDVLDGFLTALGMLAVVLPLIGGKRFEEREICFAHYAVQFDGFARIAFFVVSGDDPGVLIEGLDGGPGAPMMERMRQPITISTSAT